MQPYHQTHHDVAAQIGCAPEQLAVALTKIGTELRRERYYYYVNVKSTTPNDEPAAPPPSGRTIPAFASPDDALAFAQYHHSPEPPQVRGATKEWLLLTLLKNERLMAIMFLEQPVERVALSAQPGATRIERQRLLDEIDSVPQI